MRYLNVAGRQRFRVHAKTMVLRGDFHLVGEKILYRMVRAVMPKFELEGFPAKGQATQLVPEADAKDRHAPGKLANTFLRVADWLRIARAIGKKDAVRVQAEHVFRGSGSGNHRNFAVVIHEQAKNILLDAKIVGHDFEF